MAVRRPPIALMQKAGDRRGRFHAHPAHRARRASCTAVNMFAQAQRVARRQLKGRDVSFRAFLARQRLPEADTHAREHDGAGLRRRGSAAAPARARSSTNGLRVSSSQPRPPGGYGPLLEFLARASESPAANRGARSALEAFFGGSARHLPRRALVGLGAARGDHASASACCLRWSVHAKSAKPLAQARIGPGDPRSDGIPRSVLGKATIRAWRSSIRPTAPFPTFWTPLPMHAPLAHRLGRRSEGGTSYRLFRKESSGPGAGERAERTREYRRAISVLRSTTGRPIRMPAAATAMCGSAEPALARSWPSRCRKRCTLREKRPIPSNPAPSAGRWRAAFGPRGN